MKIYQIEDYSKSYKNKEGTYDKFIEVQGIQALNDLSKEDRHLHILIDPEKECLMFGDFDNVLNKDIFMNLLMYYVMILD